MQKTLLRPARVFDARAAVMREGYEVLLEADHISAVGPHLPIGQDTPVIELPESTVMPGLIDVHTHLLYPGQEYLEGLVTRSIPARVLDASAAARGALLNGFTSLRDVESEGSMFADVDLQRAINAGTVSGPRLWVATRGISTVGRYEPIPSNWELELPTGAQFVVGVDAARAAVREQIARGADWIKIYADYLPLSLDAAGLIRATPNFRDDELQAIIDESHRLGHKVAAHAMSHDGIAQAIAHGVDSLEHAHGLSADLVPRVLKQDIFVVPTLLAERHIMDLLPPELRTIFETGYRNLHDAQRAGVKMAYGTDLGAVPWSINGVTGLPLYVGRLGMTPAQVLRAATFSAAELLGQSGTLGEVAPGALADLIVVPGNPLDDPAQLEHLLLVFKGGQIVSDARPVKR